MTQPSRFTALGMSGSSSPPNERDYGLQTFIVPLPRVASGAEQTTNFFFPENSLTVLRVLNVRIAEATSTDPAIEMGLVGGTSTDVTSAIDVDTAGMIAGTGVVANLSGGQLTYTLSGADFEEFVGEVVFQILVAYGETV